MRIAALNAVVVTVAVVVGGPAVAAAAPTGVTVYLRRDGGTISAGWDDSAADTASLAFQGGDGEVVVPKWRGSDRAWKKVVACVRDGFSAFAVDLVERRPERGDYIMVMVGGRSSLLGYGDDVTGVSPYTGGVVPRAVSFVFPANLRNDVEGTCVSILHEVGHTLGLDHAYLCEDPMSYLFGCGKKTWQDVDADCGEDEPRACGNGADTQNSVRQLAAAVGLRGAARAPDPDPVVEPAGDAPVDPYDDDTDDPSATTAPTVSLSAGELSITDDDRIVTFIATAASPRGIADVALLWATGDRTLVMQCSAIPDDVPARCDRDGDRFTFQIRVGTGSRGVAAAAVDRDGTYTVTDPRWLSLDD